MHVVTNGNGSGDYVIVYETQSGETIFEGHSISGRDLVGLLQAASEGGYDEVEFHELTDEQMENWQEAIYE
jgi:hypothetical protein